MLRSKPVLSDNHFPCHMLRSKPVLSNNHFPCHMLRSKPALSDNHFLLPHALITPFTVKIGI